MHLFNYKSKGVDLSPIEFLNNTMSMVSGVSPAASRRSGQFDRERNFGKEVVMISQKGLFPLPWWEGTKGRGDKVDLGIVPSPPPRPSPVEGGGGLIGVYVYMILSILFRDS